MNRFNKCLITVLFSFVINAIFGQTTFDLGCQTFDDAYLDLDRKDFAGGNTDSHSEGAALNFDLPSEVEPCTKITQLTFDVNISDIDLSGLPTGCQVSTYYINVYLGNDLPFAAASIDPSNIVFEIIEADWSDLNDSYLIECELPNDPIYFDDILGIDLVPVSNAVFCPEWQEYLTGGYITMDYSICVTGEIDVAGMAQVNAISNDTEFCIGQNLELAENGLGNESWEWSGPNGFASSDQSPSYTLSDAADFGDYIVTVTDANGCTEEQTITISQIPSPAANATVIDEEVCEGQDIMLGEDAGDGISWEWSGPNGSIPDVQNPIITSSTSADLGTYTVTVTDAGGCIASSEIVVSAGPSPLANADAINTEICLGQDIELLENAGEALTWSWSGPDGFTSIGQNPIITSISSANYGSYTVTITDGNNCTSESTVTIISAPNVSIFVSATETEICPGQDIELIENGGEGDSWSWEGPDGFSSTDQNPVVVNSTIDNLGIYNVTVSDANGCSNVGSVLIEAGATPNAQADVVNFDLCLGETIELLETGGDGDIWNWEGPNSFNSDDQNPFIPNATIDDFGTFNVTVTDIEGCTNTSEISIDPMTPAEVCLSGSGSICSEECSMDLFTFEVSPSSTSLDVELEFSGTSIPNFTLQNIIEGQSIGLCSDQSASEVTFDGSNLILPTQSLIDGETVTIEIVNAFDSNNSACAAIIDNNCTVEFNFQLSEIFEIEFNGDILSDGYQLFCEPSFSPNSIPLGNGDWFLDGDLINLPVDLTGFSSGLYDLEFVPEQNDCNLPITIEIEIIACECEIIDALLSSLSCDDNDTPADASDDFITFSLDPQVISGGSGYSVFVGSGTIMPNNSTYGVSTEFQLQNGSAGGGDVDLTITDNDDPDCSFVITLIDPGSCSGSCNITMAQLVLVECNDFLTPSDPIDDFIVFDLLVDGENLSSGYTVLSTFGSESGTYGITTSFSFLPGSAGSGNVTLTIIDNNDPNCSIEVILVDPGSCSEACPDPGNCDDGDCINGEEVWDDNLCSCTSINIPDPSSCIDDGDCSNGIEEWDPVDCECIIIPVVFGCTNPTANNFNPAATCDDGSCDFDCPDPGTCDDGNCSNGEEVWNGSNCECETINIPDPTTCTDDGDCSNGEEIWDDALCECINVNIPDPNICMDDGDCLNGLETWDAENCFCEIIIVELGCTDPMANNYNPDAECDDGSCEYDCPDPGNCDDGDCNNGEEIWNGSVCECETINAPDPSSCVDDNDCTNGIEFWNEETCECESELQILGCTDPSASNYDPNAECDDGSCEFDCPDPGNCDDGDCNNGEEIWNGATCECEAINIPDSSSCVDDGDCSNGEEVWNELSCECEAQNIIDASTCVDDGDCTNGIEIWDAENCDCIIEDQPNCDNGTLIEMSCDDFDPCTENDVSMVIECSGEICVPCQGEPVDCTLDENIMEIPCDDNDDNTTNDVETILICDNSICIPCQGELKEPTIYFPDIFTPDNDGNNDIFSLYSDVEFMIESIEIYDRWGELIFARENILSTNPDHQWDGRFGNELVQPGVYIYYVKLGEPFNEVKVGDLTLYY